MSKCLASRGSRAFTLVELLVVIGIIALLISILLPSLNRARESARRVKCLSNMRQIAMAMQMWANEHNGVMPCTAGSGDSVMVDTTKKNQYYRGTNNFEEAQENAVWIAWVRVKDPFSGILSGAAPGGNQDMNITFSGLTRYLNYKKVIHNTPDEANAASPAMDALFRCPSDNVERRYNAIATTKTYRYSYAINTLYASAKKDSTIGGVKYYYDWQNYDTGGALPTQYKSYPINARDGGAFNGRIATIKNSSDRILLYDQDPQTLDDANFSPNPWKWPTVFPATTGQDLLASYHDFSTAKTKARAATGSTLTGDQTQDTRGNVVFLDGHGDFMTRKDSLRQKHTGNPFPDPTEAQGY